MIKTVKIANFKSVQELEIELGRLNVFIGENGCGKTSILEGIAMGAAASQNKLDDEFLNTRGIRIVSPELMRSAFDNLSYRKPITVEISKADELSEAFVIDYQTSLFGGSYWEIYGENLTYRKKEIKERELLLQEYLNKMIDISSKSKDLENDLPSVLEIRNQIEKSRKHVDWIATLDNNSFGTLFSPFLLFAPENHFLRRFEEEGQIRPLGIRGEGLFRHLVELSKEEPETFAAIADKLSLIDWFGGLTIPNNLSFTERRISITDRFIADTIKDFDQRSANEGFLYLLFYFTLFLSKYTPKFFAIDNIDNALNPRLCAKLVEMLAVISKEQDKQAILTTHNPAVLDGLDLADEEQRLFVIYRNADGETKARRVLPPKVIEGVEPVRLSEAFVRGYLGGLPDNF